MNRNFNLSVSDISLIENGLRESLGRLSSLYLKTKDEESLERIKEIESLLARLHHQKSWYRPSEYISG